MANPRLLWVRDAAKTATDIGDPAAGTVGFVDLLWKARQGESVSSPSGFLQNTVNPLAPDEDNPVQPQDITGCLVKRIILEGSMVLAPLTPVLPDGVGGIDAYASAGSYEGILVVAGGPGGTGTTTEPTIQPGNESASVAADWLWWRRRYPIGSPGTRDISNLDPADSLKTYMYTFHIDTRCSRRLREWDETLMFLWQGGSGSTVNSIAASWSILLERPR